jgi:hypothetical protein
MDAPAGAPSGLKAIEPRSSDTALTEQETFPGPVYAEVPAGVRPSRQGVFQQALEWVPMRDFVAARVGFAGRFNRAVKRLEVEGGHALPAAQAHFHFSDALLLSINPKIVTMRFHDHFTERGRVRWIGSHFLDGGDWRPIITPMKYSSSHKEVIELCRLRQNFRDGQRYQRYAGKINEGQTLWRNRIALDTIDKLDSYYEYYLALIADIEKNGLLPHAALGLRDQTGHRHRWTRTFWQDLAERDIGVAIDADGSLVRHTNGKHRMATALALGLKSIPVEIRLVHARWLARQCKRLGLPPAEALFATLEQARATGWTKK